MKGGVMGWFVRFMRPGIMMAALVSGLSLGGCQELVEPLPEASVDGEGRWAGFTAMGPVLQSSSLDSLCALPTCDVVEHFQTGAQVCKCTLEGLTAVGEASDPPPPSWPPFPGYAPPDPIDIGEPGGGEGGGEGGVGDCDWGCPVEVTVSLACTTGLTRGEPGQCEVVVDPPEQLEYIYRWVFQGASGTQTVKEPGGSAVWDGILVETGEVRAVVRVGGRDFVPASKILVRPRAWGWSPGNGITVDAGGMTWPVGVTSVGTSCRPGQPCPGGWLVQPYHNLGDGNGFTVGEGSGPNDGIFFIEDVTMDVHLSALVNPDMLPGGWPYYPATGADAVACGHSSSDTVFVGFTSYNENCRQQSMTPFENWAWNHEATHGSNMVTYIQQYLHPRWDAPAALEPIVQPLRLLAAQQASERLSELPECVQRAAATHVHSGGILTMFSGLPVPVWFWQAGPQRFELSGAGSTWWSPEPDSPFDAPCF